MPACMCSDVHDSAKMLRLKEAADVLSSYGWDIEDLLKTLISLRTYINVPALRQSNPRLY